MQEKKILFIAGYMGITRDQAEQIVDAFVKVLGLEQAEFLSTYIEYAQAERGGASELADALGVSRQAVYHRKTVCIDKLRVWGQQCGIL